MGFAGFTLTRVEVGGITVRVRHGGTGPPLLLLHGCPETHMMWGWVADGLADAFTVFAPDLRGYGETSKPAGEAAYAKRVMAQDAIGLMAAFGHERFSVAGHDRGGRVAYRLALDHPERIRRVSVLDIVPTGEVWARVDARLMQAYWHWAFLAQPRPAPERVIEAIGGETFFLELLLGGLRGKPFVEADAYADYARCVADPSTVAAICDDYRAGASFDRRLDEAERGRVKIGCPLQVLWGAKGVVGRLYDPLEVWSAWADNVRGEALDCGHFLPEEAPAETLAALRAFFLTAD